MLFFLNKNNILQIILSALLFGWAVFTIFTQMKLCPPEGQTIVYQHLFDFWQLHTLHYKTIAAVWVLLECFLIQLFFNKNRFAEIPTLMPMLFFLLFLNVGKFTSFFSPAFFTVLLTTLVLLFNAKDSNEKPMKNKIFSSGLLIGLATLIDPNALWIMLFLILALFANNYSKAKEICILFAGLLMVAIYTFAYFFLSNKLPVLADTIKHLQFFYIIRNVKSLSVLDWVRVSFLVFSLFYLIAAIKLYFDNKLIVLRKRFVTTVLLLVIVLIMVVFANYDIHHGMLYLIVSMSLFYSMLSQLKKRRLWNDFLAIALVVLLCL